MIYMIILDILLYDRDIKSSNKKLILIENNICENL